MQVLLFANGIMTHGAMVQRILDQACAPHIVCADGGALHARALGLKPHTIVGDLDSLTTVQVAEFRAAGAEVIQYPPEKDETALELALHHCLDIGAVSVVILAGLGGRFDQTLANIFLLTLPMLSDMQISVVDGEQVIRVLHPGTHEITGQPADTISLIPLTSSAGGITTKNLKYALRDESLTVGPARGISNVMLANTAEVAFRSGSLLLVHTIGRA